MSSRTTPKREVFAQFAILAKALGHPDRIELLEHLAQGRRSVDALARLVGVPVANASQHLQQLKRAGLVTSERDGKFVLYHLSGDEVVGLMGSLREVAERNVAELDRIVRGYFHQRDSMEPISSRELLARMKDGTITLIDVRPSEEFDLGHLPGAVSMPLAQLKKRLRELDPDREIVAYCRGPYCVLSFEAVALLRRRGFTAQRLKGGLPEWRAAGHPTTSG
ncbi:MAG: ArsR/SmtB family transcription factor [Alphaproteobacteria bacterium]